MDPVSFGPHQQPLFTPMHPVFTQQNDENHYKITGVLEGKVSPIDFSDVGEVINPSTVPPGTQTWVHFVEIPVKYDQQGP